MIDFVLTKVGILIFAIEITLVLFIGGSIISDLTEKEAISREAENIVLLLDKIQSINGDLEVFYTVDISGEIIINNANKTMEIKKGDTTLKKFFSANVSSNRISLSGMLKIKKEKNAIEVLT